MTSFPDMPFLTKKFSPRGGGIDFLGLRAVNLSMLAEYLLPGINNATRDVGTYCLGTWIPWKFQQLCKKKEYTISNYRKFRETLEIALAYAIRDHSPANHQYGLPRNRIGVRQKMRLASPLTFRNVGRTDATSLYAAPLYGPSLRYLDLIGGYAVAEDGRQTPILLASEAQETCMIVQYVDQVLRRSQFYPRIDGLDLSALDAEAIDNLALCGLHPAFFSTPGHDELKRAFQHKLLPLSPEVSGYGRTLTAKLLIDTLQQRVPLSLDELRCMWHTGLIDSKQGLQCRNAEVEHQRQRWAVFQARQVQRLILEVFLRCFELGLAAGCRSIDEITGYAVETWEASTHAALPTTFEEQLCVEAGSARAKNDLTAVSRQWNERVHGQLASYEWLEAGDPEQESIRACTMLARWYLRIYAWVASEDGYDLLEDGGPDRLSIAYLSGWLEERKRWPFKTFLFDLFRQLIFAQHLRVALARFDGEMQRLRFILGDHGIVPTDSAGSRIGESPSVMEDRLAAFVDLLEDLEIVQSNGEGKISLGRHSTYLA